MPALTRFLMTFSVLMASFGKGARLPFSDQIRAVTIGNTALSKLSGNTAVAKTAHSTIPVDLGKVLERVRANPKLDAVYKELEALVGLTEIKREVLSLIAYIWFNEDRNTACEQDGVKVKPMSSQTMHMQFLGNPGTGKTVVARIVAKILITMGAVQQPDGQAPSESKFVEASRADLVASKKGGTAIKVKKVIDSALGGVLFIDEAYSLAQGGGSFAREAVDELVKQMEDHRKELVVILAGYDKEMEKLIAMNTGLRSRLPFAFHFSDYTCLQLVQVGEIMLHGLDGKGILLSAPDSLRIGDVKHGLDVQAPAGESGGFTCATKDMGGTWQLVDKPICKEFLLTIRYHTGCLFEEIGGPSLNRENGNGRSVRNILESAYREMGSRAILEHGVALTSQVEKLKKAHEIYVWEQKKSQRAALRKYKGDPDKKPKQLSEKQLNLKFYKREWGKPIDCVTVLSSTVEELDQKKDIDRKCALVALTVADINRVLQGAIRKDIVKTCGLGIEMRSEAVQKELEKQIGLMVEAMEEQRSRRGLVDDDLTDRVKAWLHDKECDEVKEWLGLLPVKSDLLQITSSTEADNPKNQAPIRKRWTKMSMQEKCTSCMAVVEAFQSEPFSFSHVLGVCKAWFGRAADFLCGSNPSVALQRVSTKNPMKWCDRQVCFYNDVRSRKKGKLCECATAPLPAAATAKRNDTAPSRGPWEKVVNGAPVVEVLSSVKEYQASCKACISTLTEIAPDFGEAKDGKPCLLNGANYLDLAEPNTESWKALLDECEGDPACLDARRKMRSMSSYVANVLAAESITKGGIGGNISDGFHEKLCDKIVCKKAKKGVCACDSAATPSKSVATSRKSPLSLGKRAAKLRETGGETGAQMLMCETILSGAFDAAEEKLTLWQSQESKLEAHEWVAVQTECNEQFRDYGERKVQCSRVVKTLNKKSSRWYGFARYQKCTESSACYEMLCVSGGRTRKACADVKINSECDLTEKPGKVVKGGKKYAIKVPKLDLGSSFSPGDVKRVNQDIDMQIAMAEAAGAKRPKVALLMHKLQNLIGLDSVKAAVLILKRLVDFNIFRTSFFGKDYSIMGQSFHMQFLGNPGTGKTMVARIVGEILVEMGVVGGLPSSGKKPAFKLNEVSRADLVAPHVGETAMLVQQKFQDTKGGVLFVDEAYSLVHKGSQKDFGHEAVSTMIAEMENRRKQVIVILAGYQEPMREFFDTNPGFKSRVPFEFLFEDYTCEQLMQIAEMNVDRYGMTWGDAKGGLEQLVKFQSGCCPEATPSCVADPEGGNARSVRTLLERTFQTMANRVIHMPSVQEKLPIVEKFVVPRYENPTTADTPICPSSEEDKTLCRELSEFSVEDYKLVAQVVAEEALRKACLPRPDFEALAARCVGFDEKGWKLYRKAAIQDENCVGAVELLEKLPDPVSSKAVVSDHVNDECVAEARAAGLEGDALVRIGKIANMKACEVFVDLEGYIGLRRVKETMYQLYDFVLFNYQRKIHKLQMMSEVSYHMKFLGNPGTGKTVVARAVGKLLNALDVLTPWNPVVDENEGYEMRGGHRKYTKETFFKQKQDDHKKKLETIEEYKRRLEEGDGEKEPKIVFEEVSRSDLVGGFIGHTARKVQAVAAKVATNTGVLFIDEAYALKRPGKSDSFGQEAVDTLIKEMEDKRANMVVIMAGYRNEMKEFIASNPGFKSRVQFTFNFDDYNCQELHKIAGFMLEGDFSISMDNGHGEALLAKLIDGRTGCCHTGVTNCAPPKDSGNGRAVRNVLETITRRMATRLVYERSQKELPCAPYTTLNYADVQIASKDTVSERLSSMCEKGGYFDLLAENLQTDSDTVFADSMLVGFIEDRDITPSKIVLDFDKELHRLYTLLQKDVDMTQLVSQCMTRYNGVLEILSDVMGDVCRHNNELLPETEALVPLDTTLDEVTLWTRHARFFLMTVEALVMMATPLHSALTDSTDLHDFLPKSLPEDLNGLGTNIAMCKAAADWIDERIVKISLKGINSPKQRVKILGKGGKGFMAGETLTNAEELMQRFAELSNPDE